MEETQNGTEVISEKSKGWKFSGIDKINQTVDLKDNINSAIKIYRNYLSISQLEIKDNEKILKEAREGKIINFQKTKRWTRGKEKHFLRRNRSIHELDKANKIIHTW